MNTRFAMSVAFVLALASALPAEAQAPRKDVFWARSTNGAPITLDGVLNEPAWAQAESMTVRWSEDNGIPGSGWKLEVGLLPQDATRAKIKLLTVGNQLYMAASVPDSSIGGGLTFNRFDGFLMAIKDHASTGSPKPPAEYLYSWWWLDCPDPSAPGKLPGFIGRWGNFPPCSTRTAEQIANWDAVTVVNGTSNSDAVADQGYTVEMRFNLTPMGYDVTDADGDVVEWNISIYDADWFWPINATKVTGNRTWWQGPWGNAAGYHEVKVHAKPSVTTSSGPVPVVGPEMRIPNAAFYPAPNIDGSLGDAVYADMPSFDMRWNDPALWATYPGVGPHRAGTYQGYGGAVAIIDSADASVQVFHRGDSLYFAFDVRDRAVQSVASPERWDGFRVNIIERGPNFTPDSTLVGRRLAFRVGPTGEALTEEYLPFLIDSLAGARVAMDLKPGTTVDTLGQQLDTGYTAELVVNLTKLGYPAGLGDRSLFIGITHFDGDSFTPASFSYGTRIWWFNEYDNTCCPVWAYLDPAIYATDVRGPDDALPELGEVLGNTPNPFTRATNIRYVLSAPSAVTLEVFDVQGRLVSRDALGERPAGLQHAEFDATAHAAGVYFYRMKLADRKTGVERGALYGKMTLVK
ncbi:MAG: T9SS type A sorting domain-containing protein [bacterium]